jgi:uncharacterized repeat protein (TIGR03803 family)
VVFKLDPTGKETVLYSFTGGAGGSEPPPCGPSGCSLDPVEAGLIRDSAGNLYGTTPFGGTYALGVAFKLDPYGHETVLHTFTGGEDGANPFAGLIRDSAGNLYGTTANGDPSCGGWSSSFPRPATRPCCIALLEWTGQIPLRV